MIMQKDWPKILSGMLTDSRFRKAGQFRWLGEVDGEQVGVALATMNVGFNSFALNKADLERTRDFKANGKLNHAFAVAARVDGSRLTYCGCMPVEDACAKLAMREIRQGRFGGFYVLDAGFFPADEFVEF
jgi:hypothetical protein